MADDLELYEAGELLMFWSHQPRQPWQTPEYYAEQRHILRPAPYRRLHHNEWVGAENSFITQELWDACIDETLRPALPSADHECYGGVDIGIKNDHAAVVIVRRDGDRLVLIAHRIWKPTPSEPLEIEATIEEYLRQQDRQRSIRFLCDPYQLVGTIQRLKADGLWIREFPQSLPNTTRMGQILYELLKARNLALYPDDELRQQALNTVAVEHPRGWRIAKEKASRKVDGITALAMACVAAVEQHREVDVFLVGGDLQEAPLSEDEQEKLEREQAAASAAEIRRICAKKGCWWPGEF